ncbi:YqaJ viral recombinase family protein [Providencia huaxiensis]|uniref:YqaJ viral recombinase family protein n=1 Tax=Providencia huaxiensis TaxID=2027290 RepID=UPI0034DD543F
MRIGKLSEQFARHWFENQYGEISSPCCVRSRESPHMIASLDGLIENNDVVEFKNISPKNHRLLLEEKAKSSDFSTITNGRFIIKW